MKNKIKENEFWKFLRNYNVFELATGVVIGGAVKDLVASIANDLLMPIVGMVTPNGSWQSIVLKLGGAEFKIGNLISSFLNFMIIALVIFVLINKILKIESKDKK